MAVPGDGKGSAAGLRPAHGPAARGRLLPRDRRLSVALMLWLVVLATIPTYAPAAHRPPVPSTRELWRAYPLMATNDSGPQVAAGRQRPAAVKKGGRRSGPAVAAQTRPTRSVPDGRDAPPPALVLLALALLCAAGAG